MSRREVTGYRAFRQIENGRELSALSLTDVRITRAVRNELSTFIRLEELSFTKCRFGGSTLAVIATLPQLRSLRIVRSTIDLKGATQRDDKTWRTELDHLHNIPGLCELDLTKTDFHFLGRSQGSRDFDFLSRMGALTTLVLDGTPFDDSCVPALLGLTRLRRLSLRGTRVGRRAADLETMPGLEQLELVGTPAG